ncbi:MAG TPA: hypothetical protein VM802_20780 [Chitinophaga sp.]|uniref:hypothetical protein n=1 Tax=Chitinophaga sp. TaxID=1869181 RepID=UPI002BB36273|nr:hypothetical protein [Chitinophaga sp.]HVI47326.1 hypothetical protein [Chitinophaga sp.]
MAAKLDQIPVPDMADSIWASIDMQLDAVADTPDNNPDNTAGEENIIKYDGKGWYGFAAVTAAAASMWWYTHREHPVPEKVSPVKAVPAIQAPVQAADSNTTIKPVEMKPPPIAPPKVKADTISGKDAVSAVAPETDSAAERMLPWIKVDSLVKPHHKVYMPVIDSVNIPPPVRKTRGVKGITADDYRISVQKDSSGKKD